MKSDMKEEFEHFKTKHSSLIFLRKKKKDGEQIKGVGGFRPMVNWREITIKKKKIADKQILMCILFVGTFIILLGLVLLFLGLFVLNRQCPFQWLEMGGDKCLYVSGHNATWSTSRDFCKDQGGNLVDIESNEENTEIQNQLSGTTWIALYRPRQSQDFIWDSGNKATYRNWGSTPSGSAQIFTECARMDDTNGKWRADNNCNQKYFAACEFQKTYYPLVLVGPVLVICGIIVLVLSVEVCVRHRKFLRDNKGLIDNEEYQEEDPEIFKKQTMSPFSQKSLKPPSTSNTSWRRKNNKTLPFNDHKNEPETLQLQEKKSPSITPKSQRSVSFQSPISQTMGEELQVEDSNLSTLPPPLKSPSTNSLQKKDSNSSPSLLSPVTDDQSKSQEQIELLLSPKNL